MSCELVGTDVPGGPWKRNSEFEMMTVLKKTRRPAFLQVAQIFHLLYINLKSPCASRTDGGMLALLLRKAQIALASRAGSVNVSLSVTDAVFHKGKKVLRLL